MILRENGLAMRKLCISGFTSVIALLFLQLAALFALYEMRQSVDEVRIVKQEKRVLLQQTAVLSVMIKLQHEFLLRISDCVVPMMAPHTLLGKSDEWWLHQACSLHISDQTYYYILEKLSANPCAYIQNQSNKQYVTPEYYRITLYSNKIILQSTLAIPGSQRLSCASGSHQYEVYSGSQMTRLLTGLRNSPWHLN